MKILESYGKLKDDHSFDRYFWQEQGPKAIFEFYSTISNGRKYQPARLKRSFLNNIQNVMLSS